MSNSDQFDPFRFDYKISPKPVEGPLISEIVEQTTVIDAPAVPEKPAVTSSSFQGWKLLIIMALALLALSALSPQTSNRERALPPPLGMQGEAP